MVYEHSAAISDAHATRATLTRIQPGVCRPSRAMHVQALAEDAVQAAVLDQRDLTGRIGC